jgi:hypothetical protein
MSGDGEFVVIAVIDRDDRVAGCEVTTVRDSYYAARAAGRRAREIGGDVRARTMTREAAEEALARAHQAMREERALTFEALLAEVTV